MSTSQLWAKRLRMWSLHQLVTLGSFQLLSHLLQLVFLKRAVDMDAVQASPWRRLSRLGLGSRQCRYWGNLGVLSCLSGTPVQGSKGCTAKAEAGCASCDPSYCWSAQAMLRSWHQVGSFRGWGWGHAGSRPSRGCCCLQMCALLRAESWWLWSLCAVGHLTRPRAWCLGQRGRRRGLSYLGSVWNLRRRAEMCCRGWVAGIV